MKKAPISFRDLTGYLQDNEIANVAVRASKKNLDGNTGISFP